MNARVLACWLAVGVAACSEDDAASVTTPSDDPADYQVDTSVSYALNVSDVRFVVPSIRLPPEVGFAPANNNLDIHYFDGRLYLAWRQAPTHFASTMVQMHVVSSADNGQTWAYEATVSRGRDLREPRLLSIGGRLFLYFFEAGEDFTVFEPRTMFRMERLGAGDWTDEVAFGRTGEVPWDMKVRNGIAYLTSYSALNLGFNNALTPVYFQKSTDGINWEPVDPSREVSYQGGVTEVAFELTADGDAWFVTRNQYGDPTGFGSHVCFAPADDLANWSCPMMSDPLRYDSPEMFRHGDDFYLVGRRDVFDGDPSVVDPTEYITQYSSRPKRTAIYRVNTAERRVEHIVDLPSAGDTSFPSIRRTGPHTFLLANYTSPLDEPDISWFEGQVSDRGTQIYFVELTFTPVP